MLERREKRKCDGVFEKASEVGVFVKLQATKFSSNKRLKRRSWTNLKPEVEVEVEVEAIADDGAGHGIWTWGRRIMRAVYNKLQQQLQLLCDYISHILSSQCSPRY